ncbi:hypothetical protein [Liquorilactobacillus satsumensis]|uniref:Uncharacterized protein n=1 Tax=Liquorilactobacillus satsumensis DSM 16230 = JCM 12392 TaxID=1423801 RepID=A0A0R1V0F6_9LACO|nr:hypothetical protein FD50_GL000379 [Liquorilactobacillus satsumensis DSM 16230 = JCM 12392]
MKDGIMGKMLIVADFVAVSEISAPLNEMKSATKLVISLYIKVVSLNKQNILE